MQNTHTPNEIATYPVKYSSCLCKVNMVIENQDLESWNKGWLNRDCKINWS